MTKYDSFLRNATTVTVITKRDDCYYETKALLLRNATIAATKTKPLLLQTPPIGATKRNHC